MALSVSFTASVTACSEASGSAIRFVKWARVLPGASRVARPMIWTISVKAGAVADGQRALAPDPVKSLLRHAERDDDVDMVAVVLLIAGSRNAAATRSRRAGSSSTRSAMRSKRPAGVSTSWKPVAWVDPAPFAKGADDVLDLFDLVFGAFPRVDVRDVDDGLLVGFQDGEDVPSM